MRGYQSKFLSDSNVLICFSILADAPQILYFSNVNVYISWIDRCSGILSSDIVFKKDANGICKIDSTSEFAVNLGHTSKIATNGVILYYFGCMS